MGDNFVSILVPSGFKLRRVVLFGVDMGSRVRKRSSEDSSKAHLKSRGGISREEFRRDVDLCSATRYSMWLITYQLTALSRR